MDFRHLAGLLIIFPAIDCFVSHAFARKSVVEIIGPTNRAVWGSWGAPQYCAEGTYAAGYDMKIEPSQGQHEDDTSLNGIELVCLSLDGKHNGGTVTSTVGPFGNWGVEKICPENQFLKEFDLQVESSQGHGDDTAANFIKFKCGSFESAQSTSELAQYPGHGLWGTLGGWSKTCPANSAICGMRTRVEEYQHGGDDTTLNDVQFYCCNDDSWE